METMTSHHPKVLPFLFLTEMWERFGFYVAQGLLVLYMTEHYGFSDTLSDTISGSFMGLVYISPFVGGYLADKVLGFKTAIIWGGLFLCLGYALLALSTVPAFFYPALAIIITGNGLFKPNISSLLGSQYHLNDPHRDAGFTIFYVGINLGAALSGVSGYVRAAYGWPITFGLASVGMLIGLAAFLKGLPYAHLHHKFALKKRFFYLQFLLYCLLIIAGLSFLLQMHSVISWLLPGTGLLLLIFLFVLMMLQTPEYRKKMFILNVLIISSIVFWALFLQIFISANLFVERLVDKNLFGIPLTTTLFYAAEGLFVILLGPFFAWSWQTLGRNKMNPSPLSKFILGIFFAGLGFIVLSASTLFINQNGMISPLWVFGSYLAITMGELFLSPIGLSAITFLSPPNLTGMMMGVWFVGMGFGGIFAGMLAKLASITPDVQTTAGKLAIYQDAFLNYAYLAFVVSILLFFLKVGLKKWLR